MMMQTKLQTIKSITAEVEAITQDLIKIRRHLHAHPELGRAETETSRLLQSELWKHGEFIIHPVGKTGFCADLIASPDYKWLALRADMDALPIQDTKKVSYRSVHNGLCHACGHDFHSTVVLGTAAILLRHRNNLKHNIRFIFQHAEEPTPGGAIDFVRAGMLDNIHAVFGLHADPALPVQTVGVIPGSISAQSIHIKIELNGPGGHSSRPHETADPIYLGLSLLNQLYGDLSRMQNTDQPFVFTIGVIKGGESYNSISPNLIAEGTLRVRDGAQGDQLLKFIKNSVLNDAAKWKLAAQVKWHKGAPAVFNDFELTGKVKSVLGEILKSGQIREHTRSMGGEDFSQFLTKAPGVFLRVGVGKGKNLHTGEFDVDEQAIPFAVHLFAWLLMAINK